MVLSLVVSGDGTPLNLKVLKGLGLGLDEKAQEAVALWRFAPGKKDGNPVPVLATIQVNFRLLPSSPGGWHVTRVVCNSPNGASCPMPVKVKFPPDKLSGTPGSVTLGLDVSEKGSPTNVHVEKSSDPKWGEEVTAAVRGWKFDPGMKEGEPISVSLTMDFSQQGEPVAAKP